MHPLVGCGVKSHEGYRGVNPPVGPSSGAKVKSHEGEAPAKLIASSVPAVRAYDAMDIYVKVMI